MKVSKRAKKLSKEIIFASSEKGLLVQEKLERFTKILLQSREPLVKEILQEILKVAQTQEQSTILKITSAYALSEEQTEKIKNHFEKTGGKKLTVESEISKKLIAGIKVTLGDNVWENSVSSNLELLKGSFV